MQTQLMLVISAKYGATKLMALLLHAEAAYVKWGTEYLRKQDNVGLKLIFDAEMRRNYYSFEEYRECVGYNATELLQELYDYAESKYYILCAQEGRYKWLEEEKEALHIRREKIFIEEV